MAGIVNMNMKIKIIGAIIPLCAVLFLSCEEKDCCFAPPAEYIVFGHFYGYCVGEGCIEIYRIDDQGLLEDTLDLYPGSTGFYSGDFNVQLPGEKFNLVNDLESHIPAELWNETSVVLGQPDAGDWGGIYFEIKKGSTHQFWLLDQMDSNMPAAYNEFVDKINEKIALIHQ